MTDPDLGTEQAVPWLRREARYLAEIAALTGFVVTQPVLDVFGRAPDLFVFRRATSRDIVVFALLLALVPPVVTWATAALVGLALPRRRHLLQVALLTLLAGLALSHVIGRGLGLPSLPTAGGALIGAIGFAVLYLRAAPVRLWLAYAAAAPAVFLTLFLVFSPVSVLLHGDDLQALDVAIERPTRVVMLVLDELPTSSIVGSDGTVDRTVFPNFARLADLSTWYSQATTVATHTQYAVPSMLTGRYPVDGERYGTELGRNLFTLLGGTYDLVVDEAITGLCPPDLCRHSTSAPGEMRALLGDAVSAWRDMVSPVATHHDAAGMLAEKIVLAEFETAGPKGTVPGPQRFEDFLTALQPVARPTLNFLHLVLPHAPWKFYPSGRTYVPPTVDPGRSVGFDRPFTSERAATVARQRHLLQTQYLDSVIGRLLDTLIERDLFDDTLLVVAADHGITFLPGVGPRGGNARTTPPGWPDLLYVPFFVKAAGQVDGATDGRNVETVDLLPTVADLLGVDVPWAVDGFSLAGEPRRDPAVKRYSKTWFTTPTTPRAATLAEIDARVGAAQVVARSQAAFRSTIGDRWAFYRVSPHAALVGRSIDDLAVGPAGRYRARLPDLGVSSSARLPGLVRGRVEGAPDDLILALTVNGTVVGVGPTFDDAGVHGSYAFLVPDFSLHEGANTAALYEVRSAAGGDLTLAPMV